MVGAPSSRRQGAPAGKSSAPVLTLRQNVVGGVPCPPVGVTAGKYSFGMSYSVSVGRDALVPPPTRLTRCHFDRSDSGVEKSPAEEMGRRVPAPARLPASLSRRQGAPAGKSPMPVPTLWQNVVGAFPVPQRTKLKRCHFDRRDSGVERFPAIEK